MELDSPITTTSPSSEFWGINQSVKYGSLTLLSTASTAVVDSRTELILLASGK
jgi:cathepsin E